MGEWHKQVAENSTSDNTVIPGFQVPLNPPKLQNRMFCSDGNARFECSTDLLTLISESTGVMHRLSADQVKVSESWNHSDMCCDCVH